MKSIAVVIALVVGLGLASKAEAAIITDASTFSVDLADTPICFIQPSDLREEKACAGLDVTKLPAPAKGPSTEHLGYGVFRTPSAGGEGLGVIVISRTPERSDRLPDRALADTIAAGLLKGLSAEARPDGAKLLPPAVQVVTNESLAMLRTTIAIDGGPSDDLMARREMLTVFGADVRYDIVWTGGVADAGYLREVADAAVKKTKLASWARPQDDGRWHLNKANGAVLSVGVLLAVVLIVAKLTRPNPRPPETRT